MRPCPDCGFEGNERHWAHQATHAPTPLPVPLDGRCAACGQTMGARSLNMILVGAPHGPKAAFICGPCFVDGFNSEVAA